VLDRLRHWHPDQAAWVVADNPIAAADLWLLLIDEQVDQQADPNFPRRPSTRVAEAYERVAHENNIVYFDQREAACTVTVRPTPVIDYLDLEVINPWWMAAQERRRKTGDSARVACDFAPIDWAANIDV
jgi:hypothetical protein